MIGIFPLLNNNGYIFLGTSVVDLLEIGIVLIFGYWFVVRFDFEFRDIFN